MLKPNENPRACSGSINPDHKIMDWYEYARYRNDKARAAREGKPKKSER